MADLKLTVLGLCLLVFPSTVFAKTAGDVDRQVEQPVRESISTRQAAQQESEKWQADKEEMVARLEHLEQEKKRLAEEAEQLQGMLKAAAARVAAKERQLADAREISGQILPFLNERLAALEELQAGDAPFLTSERQQRITKLRELVGDPTVKASELYRKVMEAWLVEAEYGYTIEVYPETITAEGESEPRQVNVLRLGRLQLFFQSPDQTVSGFYNEATRSWQILPAADNSAIRAAIEIGKKSRPVELLSLPLGRMVTQ